VELPGQDLPSSITRLISVCVEKINEGGSVSGTRNQTLVNKLCGHIFIEN